jgi:hypothetical protein
MNEIRNAKSIFGVPMGADGEDGFHAAVGKSFPYYYAKSGPVVDMITVSADLPGPNGNIERVRVWAAGDVLLWEGPLHNLEGVQYV